MGTAQIRLRDEGFRGYTVPITNQVSPNITKDVDGYHIN